MVRYINLILNKTSQDPADYDLKCDSSLPLEDMIEYNPSVRKLFEDIDRNKVRVWALTNAYRNVRPPFSPIIIHYFANIRTSTLNESCVFLNSMILSTVWFIAIIFSRIFYVSLSLGSTNWSVNFDLCVFSLLILLQAMKQANVSDPSKCYFIDDNRQNVDSARELGWSHCVHFCEKGLEAMEGGRIMAINAARKPGAVEDDVIDVTSLEDLRKVWPEIFKSQ